MKDIAIGVLVVAVGILFFSAIDFRIDDKPEKAPKEQSLGPMEACGHLLANPQTPRVIIDDCLREHR